MSTIAHKISIASNGHSIACIDNYEIKKDCITFLFGESGIGKSMLTKAIYGLLDPEELDITIDNFRYKDYANSALTKEIRETSFFVFQEPSSHLNSLMRIEEQLNEGSLHSVKNDEHILQELWKDKNTNEIQKILKVFPKPYRPSGGEKQRVLLAMAFKKIQLLLNDNNRNKETFFVFDEPTGSLDNAYRNAFLDALLRKYRKRPFTNIIITHDYSIISEIYSRHSDLLSRVQFKELRKVSDTKVELLDFSASEYLDWLQGASVRKVSLSSLPVLTVAPQLSIFGRKLGIYGDENKVDPKPLEINKGEMAYLKAPSGVGKTTIAKVVMGLYHADTFALSLSSIKFDHKTPHSVWKKSVWGKKAGMVFQHADEALDLQATVKETFESLPAKFDRAAIMNHLKLLFSDSTALSIIDKQVKMLSGGQKQRLNLLRTFALKTDLIILDEPLNGLDFFSSTKVIDILHSLLSQGTALLMISHNEEIFDAIVDRSKVYYLAECS